MSKTLKEIDEFLGAQQQQHDGNRIDEFLGAQQQQHDGNREQQDTVTVKAKGDIGEENIAVDEPTPQIEKRSSEKSKKEVPAVKTITHSKKTAEYCLPGKFVVSIEPDRRQPKPYYQTCSCKRGLLFTLQLENSWAAGNKIDKKAIDEFFGDTLNFSVNERKNYDELVKELHAANYDWSPYHCLWIFISCHGSENGVLIEESFVPTHKIAEDFSNGKITKMSGVPKIIVIDTCRGGKDNKTVQKKDVKVLPTTDSDCLIINATTHGKYANITADGGSTGLQGVLESFTENWENDHLEEMLFDARMKVAGWGDDQVRQILEIQTTFLKRLKLTKYVQ